MIETLDQYLSSCSSLMAQPLYMGLALAGLVGGATHCAAMCTPVLVAVGADRARAPQLLALHAGRLVTYAGLGAVSAAFSRLIWADHLFALAGTLLLSCAAFLMVMAALPPTRLRLAQTIMQLYRPFAPWIYRRIGALRGKGSAVRMGMVGLLMGFMPCSMIVAAILAVSATGDPLRAALGMAVFVLATMPSLWLSVRLAGKIRHSMPHHGRWFEPAAMMMSAAVMMFHVRSLFA